MLTVGSLCTGYGGLDLAVDAVLSGRLAWVADNDPGAARILAARFPRVPNLGDLTEADFASLPPVDVLTAGFPCQPVSAAGMRKGLTDERWLFDDISRAIGRMVPRPRLLVLENVPGLLTANRGHAMARVVHGLAALGYVGRYRVVTAADAGAPHRRARVFIVAQLADTERAGREGPGHAGADRWPVTARAAQDADRAARSERRQPAPGETAGGRPRADAGRPARAPAADTNGRRRGPDESHDAPGQPDPDWVAAADADGRRLAELAELDSGPLTGIDRAPGNDAERCVAWAADATLDPGRLGHRNDVSPRRAADEPGPAAGRGAAADAERGGWDRWSPDPQRTAQHRTAAAGRGESAVEWGPYAPAITRWEHVTGWPAPAPTEPGRTGQRLSPRFVEWMMGLPPGHVTDVPGLSRAAQLRALGNGVVVQQAELALRILLGTPATTSPRQEISA